MFTDSQISPFKYHVKVKPQYNVPLRITDFFKIPMNRVIVPHTVSVVLKVIYHVNQHEMYKRECYPYSSSRIQITKSADWKLNLLFCDMNPHNMFLVWNHVFSVIYVFVIIILSVFMKPHVATINDHEAIEFQVRRCCSYSQQENTNTFR